NTYLPGWGADPKQLVFQMRESVKANLFVVTAGADGKWSSSRRITSDTDEPIWGRWSPDGRWVVFMSGSFLATANKLSILDPSVGPSRTLVEMKGNEHVAFPAWGRDANVVFFNTENDSGRISFWSVPVTGGAPRLLARDDDAHRLGRPDFATDGRRLFFTLA